MKYVVRPASKTIIGYCYSCPIDICGQVCNNKCGQVCITHCAIVS